MAPVRICDVGGWTDTWFGSPGQVCSLAAGPGVTVTVTTAPAQEGRPPIRVVAPDIDLDHQFGPSRERGWAEPTPSSEPLLEHAVAEVLSTVDPEARQPLEISVSSAVPAGSALGTSASVVVALVAAVRGLWSVDVSGRGEMASTAHRVETERAQREAGVQDHWAASYGGALHLAIDTYPDVRRLPLDPPPGFLDELGERVVTVAFGPHDSSEVHQEVIRAFLTCDGVEHDRVRRASRDLAALAREAASHLAAGDVGGWADVLTRSTEAQARMHPNLVGRDHHRAIQVAEATGAIGWKVNGAGGAGGSLSIVAPPSDRPALERALHDADPTWQILDLRPTSSGVTVERFPIGRDQPCQHSSG